ncbi:MAG: gamma-glutamyltransferase [Gammaproteobacteria bacterium]|nr:MAG: gamma-glutamyltransferase [Gammaproteobacteria bacterium]UCH39848.1 MAG: gamma-glutamyltransferase [Gammaproteobacteria bacterium]
MKTHCRFCLAAFALVFSFAAMAVPAEGTRIMISAPSAYAVEAGKAIYARGGNLIDVAVTVGLTLSVTNPSNASLGGGGFALVSMGQGIDVLDFREMAPASTSPDFYVKRGKGASWNGGAAIGVPGVPAGLWALHERYGKLSWPQLFDAAIRLAQDGIEFSGTESRYSAGQKDRFNTAGLRHFYKTPEQHYKPGEVLKQPALAQALQLLRDQGPAGFYSGDVARDIAATVQAEDGVITAADLANYRVRWLQPLETEFHGHRLYTMPPPSSGGAVIKAAFELFDKVGIDQQQPLSVDEIHLMAEVLNRSFRGRALLGDPDFHDNPLDLILSPGYLDQMARSIDPERSVQLEPLVDKAIDDSSETTQFSVLDADGNAITLTVTLNGSYGSGVVSDKYGISLNNEMDDFTTRPGEPNMFGLVQGYGNRVQPGKRPLSSMSPTMVAKDGRIVMALGAAGGPRIISSVIQTIYRVLVTGLDIDRAVQFPRVHHQFLPNKLYLDEFKFSPEIVTGLQQRGHVTVEQRPGYLGRIKAVRLNDKNYLEAAYDNRSEGAVGGY